MQNLYIERSIFPKVSIAIIEKHTLVRKGIRNLIHRFSYSYFIQEFDAVSKIQFDKTDPATVFLLGTSTPLCECLELMEILNSTLSNSSALILLQSYNIETLPAFIKSGIHGILDQHATEQDLDIAIKTCSTGNTFRSRRIEEVMKVCSLDKVNILTLRELQVLTLLGKGEDNVSIAQKLQITNKTVEAHITRIFGKLGVKSRVQAVLRAQNLNLINLPERIF